MTFSPLGNSFISKFAPARLLSAMMAVWTFAILIAGLSYGPIYNWLMKNVAFSGWCIGVAVLLIAIAAILWIMDKKLNSLVVDEK